MGAPKNVKKRVVIGLENLTDELREALKARYPLGWADSMIRINKPSGDFFYGVVLETEETSYLVKVKVKIDQNPDEEFDKEPYSGDEESDEIKGADDIADSSEDSDD